MRHLTQFHVLFGFEKVFDILQEAEKKLVVILNALVWIVSGMSIPTDGEQLLFDVDRRLFLEKC